MQEDFAWMKAELNAIYDAAVEKKSADVQAAAIAALALVMVALDTVKYQPTP